MDRCGLSKLVEELNAPYVKMIWSHAGVFNSRYSLPRHIGSMVKLKGRLSDLLDDTGTRFSSSIWDDVSLQKNFIPLFRTVIYCAPCACLIQTAILICQRESSTIHEYYVRLDDRLVSCCCLEQDRIAALKTVYDDIRHSEASTDMHPGLRLPYKRYFDM